jgi:RND family efflux transporter MFP subunit
MAISSPNHEERPGAVHATRADNGAAPEQDLWRRFVEASTQREFCQGWLALQCSAIGTGVRCALVLLGPADSGPYAPAAVWPGLDQDVTHLVSTAEQSLKERRGLLLRDESSPTGNFHVAYPLEIIGKLHGVVILETTPDLSPRIQSVLQQLHWGAAWLEVMLLRADVRDSEAVNERFRGVLGTMASALEHEKFQPSAMAFVTQVATLMDCERVSLGFVDKGRLRIRALSHSAEFGEKANLVRAIETAMEEAIDQRAIILYPPPPDAPPLVLRGHEALSHQYGAGTICTLPLGSGESVFGALSLEIPSGKALNEPAIEQLKTIASLAGPILNTKRKEDRLLITKALERFRETWKALAGPNHPALKTAGAIALVLLVFFSFAEGTFRVKATTVLEGSVQRVMSAPFSGYIAEAPARPGDVVQAGATLCRLDDRDLKLELSKSTAQRDQLQKEFRANMAKHDFAQVRIVGAKVEQAQAQIDLLTEQLSRAKVTAPFDGVVMSGDLSQSLGAPVERGQVLFEVAPLDNYRVIIQVDERDISYVQVGQHGELVLPSLPGESYPLVVSSITPVSMAKEGRNFFRVEAQVEQVSKRLRPGMEGVGKIDAGDQKLIWIWTHEMIDWFRLKLWSWLP